MQDVEFKDIYPKKRLPHTIDEREGLDNKGIVTRIATQYLHVVKKFKDLEWDCGKCPKEKLKTLVPDSINEEKSRNLISHIHNLQSIYDHHIKRTYLESQDKDLPILRGCISMPLHLLSIVNWLTHLYERHIKNSHHNDIKNKIASIIDEVEILDVAVNFALYHCSNYLKKGERLSYAFLEKYIEIVTYELKIPKASHACGKNSELLWN